MNKLRKVEELQKYYDEKEKILKILKNKDKKEKLISLKKDYINFKKQKKELENNYKELKITYVKMEEEISYKKSNIIQKEESIYSDVDMNAKALKTMEKAISLLKEDLDKLNENQIQIFQRLDKNKIEQKEKDNKILALEKEFNKIKKEGIKEERQEKESLKEIDAVINNLRNNIDINILKIYDDIRKRKKDPIAHVNDKRCDGCRMELPSLLLRNLKNNQNEEIYFCDFCGRILYMKK